MGFHYINIRFLLYMTILYYYDNGILILAYFTLLNIDNLPIKADISELFPLGYYRWKYFYIATVQCTMYTIQCIVYSV